MEEVKYQVEHDGDGVWQWYGPEFSTYNQARAHMAYEITGNPSYDYRIVRVVTSKEIVTTVEAEG